MKHLIITGSLDAIPVAHRLRWQPRQGKVFSDGYARGGDNVERCLSVVATSADAAEIIATIEAIEDTFSDAQWLSIDDVAVPHAYVDRVAKQCATWPRIDRNGRRRGVVGYWPIDWQWAKTVGASAQYMMSFAYLHTRLNETERWFVCEASSALRDDPVAFADLIDRHAALYLDLALRFPLQS